MRAEYPCSSAPDQRDVARSLLRRTVAFANGDSNARDLARVLRVPDTLYLKRDCPRQVITVESLDVERMVALADFERVLPPDPQPDARADRNEPLAADLEPFRSKCDADTQRAI